MANFIKFKMESSYIKFTKQLNKRAYKFARALTKAFNNEVDKKDYLKSDKPAILRYLCRTYL